MKSSHGSLQKIIRIWLLSRSDQRSGSRTFPCCSSDSAWCLFTMTAWSMTVDVGSCQQWSVTCTRWEINYWPIRIHRTGTFKVPAWHQPAKGRRSQPHPRPSQFRWNWYSPLPSFWWRLSSLLCLWTGILSHRWTPTCKRIRMRLSGLSASYHATPQHSLQQTPQERTRASVQSRFCITIPYVSRTPAVVWLGLYNFMVVVFVSLPPLRQIWCMESQYNNNNPGV